MTERPKHIVDVCDDMVDFLGVQNEPGWSGMFHREQADGAIQNGTRVVKHDANNNDAAPDGTTGTILGSFTMPEIVEMAVPQNLKWNKGPIWYYVEWDNLPKAAVLVNGNQMSRLQS